MAVLDEPCSALPEDDGVELLELLYGVCRSVIFTTHSEQLWKTANFEIIIPESPHEQPELE